MNEKRLEVDICKEETDRAYVHVTAILEDSELTISGYDSGKAVSDFWGGSDYEYWYYFDKENTSVLFSKIGASKDEPLTALKAKFHGLNACRELRQYCEEEKIKYRFESWT